MKKLFTILLVVSLLLSLCACGNTSVKEEVSNKNTDNTVTTTSKPEIQEVKLGDTIELDFMEMTIDQFIIFDGLTVEIDEHTSMILTDDSAEKKTIYLTGKITNLHTDMIGGTLGDIDCIFGNACFNEKYNYKFEMMINNKEDTNGLLQPLTTGDFYLYAQVPNSIANEFDSCSVRFAFNENLTAIDIGKSTDFNFETCEYQYIIKDIKQK